MNYKKYKNSSGKNYLWIIIKSSKEIDSNGVHLKAIKNFKFDPRRKNPGPKLRSTIASSYERTSKGNAAAPVKIYTVPLQPCSFALKGTVHLNLGLVERRNGGTTASPYMGGGEGVEEEGSISVLSRCRWNKWIRSVTVVNPRYRWHDPHTLARTRAIRTLSLSRLRPYAFPALYPLPRIVERNRGPCFSLHLSHLRFIYQLMHDTIVVDPEE